MREVVKVHLSTAVAFPVIRKKKLVKNQLEV